MSDTAKQKIDDHKVFIARNMPNGSELVVELINKVIDQSYRYGYVDAAKGNEPAVTNIPL